MKNSEIKSAKTAALVSFYNDNCSKIDRNPVKKFVNRVTAEKRVASLIEDLEYIGTFGTCDCPNCGTHLSNGVVSDEGNGGHEVNGEFIKLTREHVCLACGEEFGDEIAAPKKRGGNNSAGIAASWLKPEVAAKRAQRSAVEVDEVYYSSVPAAFRELGLPMKTCIAFRMHLKEVKETSVDGRSWKIVPLNYDK